MPLDLDAIGTVADPEQRSWDPDDALLYSLGVGAGYPDPTEELEFTTENTSSAPQQVLPTFGVVMGMPGIGAFGSIGSFNPAMLVHADQGIEIHSPIQPSGTIRATTTVVDIADKRSGALVSTRTVAEDAESGEALFTTTAGMFIRGEGGFSGGGSESGSGAGSGQPNVPERDPDHEVTYDTLPHQALIYRLCGDRNPLHSDPQFAALGGFDRPILHGLCTYGFTGRALLHTLCDGDPRRFGSMYGRFSRPVMPGDRLTVQIWIDADGRGASFRTSTSDGSVVVDRGRFGTT
ncbi:MAG: enoyl-CoA hydratase [Microthrixaceae bacterium]|nr:enoyl-CoA hydratase [Microthrixaceae bacterium]